MEGKNERKRAILFRGGKRNHETITNQGKLDVIPDYDGKKLSVGLPRTGLVPRQRPMLFFVSLMTSGIMKITADMSNGVPPESLCLG